MKIVLGALMLITGVSFSGSAQNKLESDTISTSSGNLVITFVGHGSLIFTFNEKVLHIDPYSKMADYSQLPDADMILITHAHQDHLDLSALKQIRKQSTVVIGTESVAEKVKNCIVMNNGDKKVVSGLNIKAVPAYNIVNKRDNGEPFHPKGEGNGYVVKFGNKRLYIAGDTEDIPEMKQLDSIDVAFLPMNLPYTMTPEMVADAAKTIQPEILYPYHYGETDPARLKNLLKSENNIEVRIRNMR